MAELTKELLIDVLNDLSGKNAEGERNSNMSVLLGHIQDNELIKENYSTDEIINATASFIYDPVNPSFLNLTIESDDVASINILWAKYHNFTTRLVNKEPAIMQFNALGVNAYKNADDEYDSPFYMAISLTNPIMAHTSKSNPTLNQDDTISFLIPMNNVVIESVMEEKLEIKEPDFE